MRDRFAEQLDMLNRELVEMGALCEYALKMIMEELQDCELTRGEEVSRTETAIDEKEREIEQLCLRLLLQQQPVARDLRLISAALKMITDMERIGDQAQDIAEILNCDTQGSFFPDHVILQMAQVVMQMVTESVDAYVQRDMKLVETVIARDDEVDRLFLQERQELITIISADPQSGEIALDQLMIAKYLERIGDHAVNIANWVQFSITGNHGRDTK